MFFSGLTEPGVADLQPRQEIEDVEAPQAVIALGQNHEKAGLVQADSPLAVVDFADGREVIAQLRAIITRYRYR